MNERVKEFVIDYLEREYKLPDECDFDSFNFVKTGYVDSVATIQFITTIEDEFGIEFTDEELVDPDTQIIGNLIRLITNKMQ